MEYIEVTTTKGIKKEIVYNIEDFPYDKFASMDLPLVTKRKHGKYYNISSAFDIETTSMRFEGIEKPQGFMYIWQFCLIDTVVMGRTWEEYIEFMNKLKEALDLSSKKKTLVIYVHFLSYEFQFIKDFFHIESLFARDKRKVIKFSIDGFEFRCSYFLSNMSLKKFCENSELCYHYKAMGDLDYSIKRTPYTPLTNEEKGYCYNDVRGLCECIDSKLQEDTILTIPLTSTGYVRRDYRTAVKSNRNNNRIFKKTALNEHLYEMLKGAFRGGNTHANRHLANKILENLRSFDIQSSYPSCIMMDDFPIGKFTKVHLSSEEKLKWFSKHRCLIMDVSFYNVDCKDECVMPYIPIAKCFKKKNITNDNGRVLKGDYIRMYITEIDLEIIRKTYDLEGFVIHEAYCARKGKLPKELREKMMEYYEGKTLLKGVDGKEYEYMKSKNKLNATFGMMVTALLHTTIEYDEKEMQWDEIIPSCIEDELSKFYSNRNNFLSYQWGVWVTANARKRLQTMLDKVGLDAVYTDTDSIKFQNMEHVKEFEEMNKIIKKQCEENDIPAYVDRVNKKTNEVERFYLGTWDDDGHYDRFMTLGAKKYAYEHIYRSGEIELHVLKSTVSGMSKDKGSARISILENFKIGTTYHDIGRTTSWYNDCKPHKITVDGCTFTTASNIATLEATYTLGITNEYWSLIFKDKDEIDNLGLYHI